MVNIEAAKRVAPGLLLAGKHWLLESIQNVTRRVESDDKDKQSEKQPQQASTEYLVYNWLESLFAWLQVIILWHEPLISLCAITGLLTSFLLLTCFAPRFYATIMIALFIYNLNRYWFRHIWPDIRVPPSAEREAEMRLDVDRFTYLHPQLMTLAELGQHLENLIVLGEKYTVKLLLLRSRRPMAFCSIVCTSLSCTAYIGNQISGFRLIFSIFALVLTAPGIYHRILPEFSKQWLKKNFNFIRHKINHIHHIDSQEEPVTTEETKTSLALQGSQGDETITYAAVSDVELLASSIASSTKAQALSLFDHFKRKGFSLSTSKSQQEAAEPSHGNSGDQHQPSLLATAVPSPTIDVPRNNDQDEHQSVEFVNEQSRQRRHHNNDGDDENDQDEDQRSRPELNGGNFSSNASSVSLIDSDDEQQDGFVLL